MRTVTQVDTAKDLAQARVPIKVCIHVLRKVRNDFRAMRSATALIGAGFSVSIVDIETDRSLPAEENISGVRMKHVVIPSWHTARRFEPWFFVKAIQALILSTLQLLRMKADIYHANELTALPAACIAALLRRKPLIFEIYDLQFPVPETGIGFWRRLGGLLTNIQAVVLPRCAAVIATSPHHVQEIRSRFNIKEVSLVRNVPPYQLVQKNDRLRQHLGLASNVRIALYQGGLQPNRRLDRLIRAARFLGPDIVIALKGKDMLGTQAVLEALIASEGVADRVKFTPFVPYEESLDWAASADIGLILYTPEYSLNVRTLLPNKFFEYLMAGLPVLSSSLGAITDLIESYDVGQVVTSLEPEDIGNAINSMLADQAALDRMHRNALNAAKEFCWERESKQLIRLYHLILAGQDAR